MLVNIINKNSQGRIRYILKNKKYLFFNENNDYIVISLDDISIVCRIQSNDKDDTMNYINKYYKEKFRQEINRVELEKIIKIPEIAKTKRLDDAVKPFDSTIVNKKPSLFTSFKIDIIHYIDFYNVRNLENEKLIPEFKKIKEHLFEVTFTNESEGNNNKIIFNVNNNTNTRYKHFYNEELYNQNNNLKELFK